MRRLRRSALAAATVLATAVLGSAGAAASQATDNDVRVTSPGNGAVVGGRVPLEVEVQVGPVQKVDVRLSQDGQAIASGTAFVSLPCVEGCDEGGPTRWGGRTFDAQAGAPFSPRSQCNGRWLVQPRVDGGQWLSGSTVLLSAPPSAPSNIRIEATEEGARVTWTPDRSPDVVFHRIERSTGGGPFTVIATLPGAADSYEDRTLRSGDHAYRVVAARPDGRVDGQPAVPCTDDGADLVASSRNTAFTYDESTSGGGDSGDGSGQSGSDGSPSGDGTPSGDGSGQSGEGGSGTGESGDGGTGSDGTASGEGGAQGPSDDASASPSPRPTRSARPVPPPPSAERRTSTGMDVPALQRAEGGEDDGFYYGEDMGFSEEIDYGDAPLVAGEPEIVGYDEDGEPIYEVVRQPGEVVAFGVVSMDSDKIRTLALGLLLATLALHARRWINA